MSCWRLRRKRRKKNPDMNWPTSSGSMGTRTAKPTPCHYSITRSCAPSNAVAPLNSAGHLDQCDSCGYQHPAYNSCLMGSKLLWGVIHGQVAPKSLVTQLIRFELSNLLSIKSWSSLSADSVLEQGTDIATVARRRSWQNYSLRAEPQTPS